MMIVVGYYDLRPVDWASGRRVLLPAGEGHVCDRCGAEHAVVYVVQDENGGRTYKVGSSCAKAQFGFDVEKDADAKNLVKTYKQQAAAELDERRQQIIAEAAAEIVAKVRQLTPPECQANRTTFHPTVCWICGDSRALASFDRTDTQAQAIAREGWYGNRIRELIPTEWSPIEVLLRPGTRDKTKISMSRATSMLAM